MKKVIIDGVEYIPVTPEVNEEKRLSGWVFSKAFELEGIAPMSKNKNFEYTDTRMIEIRDSEIIVSEDKVGEVLSKYVDSCWLDDCMAELGFKKDGV